ncbi:MAG TPA: recombinase family protein [Symbiobacteriaceae bacterium]|nr:recombinase family protein [Symbiobacteriaceae bacterium]
MQSAEPTLTKANRTVKVAVYLRVSTVDQGKRGFSIPEQRKACLEKARALAKASEAEEPLQVESYEFVDTAGGDLIERPELSRAREFVKESSPDYFICLDPDRFSRATYQAILIANEIEAAGTKLEFVQHDYQATSEGRLFFTLRVAIAEYEKAKILERTTRGKRGKMAAGGIPHHLRAYGYDHISEAERQVRHRDGQPDPGSLVPNPTEAAWVRQMYEWVVQEEAGSMIIAERLNQMAVPAKNGGPWRRGVVNDIIHNPIYIGQLRLNRWDFTGLGGQLHLPKEKRTKKLTPKQRPEDQWITVSAPAILEQELWERAQAVLQNIKRRSSTRLAPGRKGHFLSGVLTCGLCGAPVHYVYNNSINGYLLRCANRYPLVRGLKETPPTCPLPHIKGASVEAKVWHRIRTWFQDPDLLEADLARQQEEPSESHTEIQQKLAELAEQLDEAKTRQSRVLYLVSKGVVHPEVAEAQLGEIKRHLDALEQQQGSLRHLTSRTAHTATSIDRLVGMVRDMQKDVLEEIDRMDVQQRQTLVRMLLKEVVIHGKDRAETIPAL